MNINGRHYDKEDVSRRLSELETAVQALSVDAPLRRHFEFLLGVIDAHERGEFLDEDTEEKPRFDYEVLEKIPI